VWGLTACGGGDEDPITQEDYEAICEGYQECYSQEQFEGFFGSFQACVNMFKTYAEALNGQCRQATEAYYKCQADHIQCMGDEVSTGGVCDEKYNRMQDICND
jgi:hypothetical protein